MIIGQREPDWNMEELDYLEAKQKAESGALVAYQPEKVTHEALNGMGPAVALGQWGMSEVIHECLNTIDWKRELDSFQVGLVARMQVEGLPIGHGNKTQGEAIQRRVAQMLAGVDATPSLRRREPTEESVHDGHLFSDAQKQELLQKLLGGRYTMKHAEAGDVVGHVERHAHRNEGYFPEDGNSLVRTVRALIPVGPPGGAKTSRRMQARTTA